jgi:hypothetical protein
MIGKWRDKGYHRAVWCYEQGLISKLPSRAQFDAGCAHMRLGRAIVTRSRPLLRQLLNKQAFRPAGMTVPDAAEISLEATKNSAGRLHRVSGAETELKAQELRADRFEGLGAVDRIIARMNEIDVLRASLVHTIVPCASYAGLGFMIDASYIANHLLYAPHPCEQAVWDLQLLQPESGGLELFEQRIEEAREAKTLRGKILRTLGTRRVARGHRFELVRTTDATGQVRYVDAATVEGGEIVLTPDDWDRWYDHVHDTITRARDFQYLSRPDPESHYAAPTVPGFLECCAELQPGDFEFFKSENPMGVFPEIDWPRSAA